MINIEKVYDVEIDWNGRTPDIQKFVDMYISAAMYFDEEFHTDRELLDEEIDWLMENEPDWCYEQYTNHFY